MKIEAIKNEKAALRRAMRQDRARLNAHESEAASQAICGRLRELLAPRDDGDANSILKPLRGAVAVYLATRAEADVDNLARELLARGVRVAAPVASITGATPNLDFFALRDLSHVRPGAFGVREPLVEEGEAALKWPEIAVFLVPGLAFTRDGSRLGQGGGFYDRVLKQAREAGAMTIGVCFDCQIVEYVPLESHDRKVALVVSQTRLFKPEDPKRLTVRARTS